MNPQSQVATLTSAYFEDLSSYGMAPALIDASTGNVLSYAELSFAVQARVDELNLVGRGKRCLVFLEAKNDASSLIDYLACLQGRHVVHLVESLSDPKTAALIELYRPNLLIHGGQTPRVYNDSEIALHPDLALLLSTSGSTGSPKFVKLSARNLDSNARAIAGYLQLNQGERAFQHLKPFYSYGLSVINSHLSVGACLILSEEAVKNPIFWQQFNDYAATSFAGVPYTFETLKRSGFSVSRFKSLRYATQAGGRLEPELVRFFAQSFTESGRAFYVMYGQTEAAPRIAYLPPDQADKKPNSIGLAVPGGRLFIVDADGNTLVQPNVAGELAYEGPNIMMGYATEPMYLALDETPARLLTGDVATQDEDGLFYIVGRTSRFVKPFGVRVNLDEVQSYLKNLYPSVGAVAGDDHKIVIAVDVSDADTPVDLSMVAERFGLSAEIFRIVAFKAIPVLANGKYDYQTILEAPDSVFGARKSGFLSAILETVKTLLGLNDSSYASITDIYQAKIADGTFSPDVTFAGLGVDSLAFVGIAIEIEALFNGHPPEGWQTMPLVELEHAFSMHNLTRTVG